MKFTKTLLTTALLAFSTAMVSPISYANDAETQFQQGIAAAEKGDHHTAFKLFKPLAEQGDAIAQGLLGASYAEGKGVKQDYTQAFKWYQKAADQGLARAQFDLGNLYLVGLGVKQDPAQAVKWYLKAEEQEHVGAQVMLGILAELTNNMQQAKYWFGKACDNGDQYGCNMYRKFNEAK